MKTMMPYRYSCPLYLDVQTDYQKPKFNLSDNNSNHSNFINQRNQFFYQREEISPTNSMVNFNTFYDSVLSSGHPAFAFLNGKSHVATFPFHQYLNSKNYQDKRLRSEDLSSKSKSSFSIDSILGLNGQRATNNNFLLINGEPIDFINSKEESGKYVNYNDKGIDYSSKANISSVSPDSTAKDQNLITKHNAKGKNLFGNNNNAPTNINYSLKRDISSVGEDNETSIVSSEYQKTPLKSSDIYHQSQNNQQQQGKSKRVRTIFTPEQLERLESQFERQQYMVGHERLYLASELNLTEAQVKVWFQNRRIKHRKQYFEKEQAMMAQMRNQRDDNGEVTTDD